jgi:hypothetical protein
VDRERACGMTAFLLAASAIFTGFGVLAWLADHTL